MKEIERFAGADVNRMLVGNKCDLEAKRKIDKERATAFSEENGIPFFETSAKYNQNVEEAFLDLTRGIKQRMNQTAMDPKKTNLVNMKYQNATKTQKDACAC